MTGTVEDAKDPFSMWVGGHVFMSGVIEFLPNGAPLYAPGTFRIN